MTLATSPTVGPDPSGASPEVTLAQIVAALEAADVDVTLHGAPETVVVDATHDSRAVRPGWVFCAVVGASHDGHDHAASAVEAGATALLVERRLPSDVAGEVAQLVVEDSRRSMGLLAAAVHRTPSADLTAIGITGTNGKTTTAHLVESIVGAAGLGSGLIGTIGAHVIGEQVPGLRTTPESTDLQRLLRTMVDRGVDVAAMEVSSHGVELHRVTGTRFAVAGFTNLSQDHLDFHPTMDHYFAAKARLFTPVLADRGVVVVEDDWGHRLLDEATIPVVALLAPGVEATSPAELGVVRLTDVATTVDGTTFALHGPADLVPDENVDLRTGLVGDFNATNAALAWLTARLAGIEAEAATHGLARCPGVPGRMQRVEDAADVPAVFVDYAHTPDAIEAVVRVCRGMLAGEDGPTGRVTVVVGAGGDRDRAKRPLMGAAAATADRAVLTTDNPRSEDPRSILDAVMAGAADGRGEVLDRLDRAEAIREAIAAARPGDVVVVAGKGHEQGQTFADGTRPFDDREVARQALLELRTAGHWDDGQEAPR